MRHTRPLVGVAVLFLGVVAACTESPTGQKDRAAHRAANGIGFGSGHVVPVDTQSAVVSSETTAASDTTGRTGLGFGSGH